ncbi:carboxynorspermidine decarboxylase [Devosia nitrariae]|uniref:carboxynorspermidine decarboxylase n=1 Tax=Devosia nitrariae TaxID=2071872 RepID=UPI0024E0D002|nr:carboxynorspermidine decarboxylase [Devosia nitrariae]
MPTPYYLVDKTVLLKNLEKISYLRQRSGVKCLLALKCFATWSVFDLMAEHMDGTTSSSLNEVRLGREKFGGETHAYSVAFGDGEIDEVIANADKVIFNSLSQLERFHNRTGGRPVGLRLNPQVSYSNFIIADPARPNSRLGEWDMARIEASLDKISGVMIHCHCENGDFDAFSKILAEIEEKFGAVLERLDWVSLGGGIHFTGEDYPLEALAERLKGFAERYGVEVYLEPGEAAITNSTSLEVTVLDTVRNGKDIAIVDSSIEAHMLDLLIYRLEARIAPDSGAHNYMIAGKSCLAGDIFGEFQFDKPLSVGDRISISDAGGYTMVKKNWFNGVQMPSIAVRELDGRVNLVKGFTYTDYVESLS